MNEQTLSDRFIAKKGDFTLDNSNASGPCLIDFDEDAVITADDDEVTAE